MGSAPGPGGGGPAGAGVFAWRPGEGLVPTADGPGPLLAADSWLVDGGRVRGLALHRRRFADACAAAGPRWAAELDGFWPAAVARLPAEGAWFPRVELAGAAAGTPAELRLRVRPAPPVTDRVTVWVGPPGDPRRAPRRKGPDLDRLAELRRAAAAAGAGEALLRTGSGVLLEAAHATLLWWDGAALCVPGPDLPVLAGVTAGLVLHRARGLGIEVRERRCELGELAGREVWLTNALHGIRPVAAWAGAPLAAGEPARAAAWRSWLGGLGEPLPAAGPATGPAAGVRA